MGKKSSHFEAEKRGNIYQSHSSNIGYSQKKLGRSRKKETTGVLTTRHHIGQPSKTTGVDDIVRPVKKNPKKQQLLTSPTTSSEQTWRYHNPQFKKYSKRRITEVIPPDANLLSAVRKGKSI